jgi:hypothetical protein
MTTNLQWKNSLPVFYGSILGNYFVGLFLTIIDNQ